MVEFQVPYLITEGYLQHGHFTRPIPGLEAFPPRATGPASMATKGRSRFWVYGQLLIYIYISICYMCIYVPCCILLLLLLL